MYGPEASMTGICKQAIDYIEVSAWVGLVEKIFLINLVKLERHCKSLIMLLVVILF